MVPALVIDLIKYLLIALVVYFTVRLAVKAYLDNEQKKRDESRKPVSNQITLPLRLQAYERFILLLERITPAQAFTRTLQPGMTAYQLQVMLIRNIREEFEHNMAQQIYISTTAWTMIKSAKEEIILLINTSAAATQEGTTADELARNILERWADLDQNPVQAAIDQLKSEVRDIF